MNEITYTSDQSGDYVKALTNCRTLDQLQALLVDYKSIAPDALDCMPRTMEEFATFRKGLSLERRGKFSGEVWNDKYGAILMPEIMFKVGMTAVKFGAPWGCAYLRMKESGLL